jgi:LETM1 and EF-hand domain-containing protein 1
MQRVRKDYIKFIPFSFFIVVPGAELLLPAWLLIFPSSIPSQFLSAEEKEAKINTMLKK